MGDSDAGSSDAAQGALDQDIRPKKGLFSWIAEAFGAPDEETDEETARERINGRNTNGLALGLLNLRRMRVEDVAIPQAEIVAVPQDITKDDLVKVFRDSGMTRLPVYNGTLDSPTGMIHLKDFALEFGFNGPTEDFSLVTMLRPLLYAPPSMPIGVLLQKMQSQRMHMALVIDEYGGVDGLVTIEDLIEQVVGEIEDEHDTEEDRNFTTEKPGTYLAQAKTPIEEFEAETGLKLVDEDEEEEIDTLGGLVFMLAGRVPARGEVIPHPEGLEFEVVDADPRRIKRLRVRVPQGG
ncbi:transporter associated domain-containing protein [Anianabacter salinae]|uniref:transporter associated domain-containing protein n=1 Tax=Anianabacter salinae TaxID=2851023 RepID=UPI00225DF554|nr:hemolysin family protein [Anianabacter salinae]MBV0912726.1 hemolysin family protein [Anianabacter salinae]